MIEKLKRLEALRARIVRELYLDEWRDVWFFPRFDGVDGWRGTERVMFVGLAPSTGHFPTEVIAHPIPLGVCIQNSNARDSGVHT